MNKGTKIFIAFLGCFLSFNVLFSQQSQWNIDTNHSAIGFEISYFGIGTVKGSFDQFEGSLSLNGDDITDAQFTFTIQAASINTNQKTRDEHLRGTDFFNVQENPEIQFNSTAVKKTTDKNYQVEGTFLMGGISKSINLQVTDKGDFFHPRFKRTVKVLEVTGVVLREQHGIGTSYGPAAKALGNEVAFKAQIQLTEKTNSGQ